MYRLLPLAVLLLATSACGFRSGIVRDSITQVLVKDSGFQIVKTDINAAGTVGAVFCSIPVGEKQITRKLMQDIHAQAQLGPNQMLVNLREDRATTSYLGFYCKFDYTISADVIQFN